MGKHGKYRPLVRRLGLAICLLTALTAAPVSACRLALALALDVSGSVSDVEYRLQIDGIAQALADPEVEAALFASPGTPVALAVYEWSASRYQRVIMDWTLITQPGVLDRFRSDLARTRRIEAPEATGLGAAMEYARHMFERGPDCWAQTLDISGDGKNNDWPDPRHTRASGRIDGMRINGLVIAPDTTRGDRSGVEAGELSAYFRARIIQGPDAFIEVATGYEDYARAMRRKLLRELQVKPIGQGDFGVPLRQAMRQ